MLVFQQRVTKEIIGCPGPFNACADPVVCNGMGIYLVIPGDRVTAAHWWCGECSDDERYALELACRSLVSKELASIHALDVQAFTASGAQMIGDLQMACARVFLAVEVALLDHEVKSALARAVGHPVAALQKLKPLGFVGRPGQQRLKTILEGQLARFNLRVPLVKAQEWTAFGTIEDCSRWVQSTLKTEVLNEVMQRCYPAPA